MFASPPRFRSLETHTPFGALRWIVEHGTSESRFSKVRAQAHDHDAVREMESAEAVFALVYHVSLRRNRNRKKCSEGDYGASLS